MILCLDVGNTLIHGGVFEDFDQRLQFRLHTTKHASSDELGVFLRNVLRENGVDHSAITRIALCTVVPTLSHALRNCCLKYFDIEPFVLQAGVRTGLQIKYRNPLEVGADRIANAIAAVHTFPNQNLIVADLGTATTLCAVNAHKEYLGGVIMAGLKISAEALENRTAQLPSVAIVEPKRTVGRSTVECIQSGLYYGTLGMLKELIGRMRQDCFGGAKALIIGTSGFAGLFEKAGIFDEVIPDLVLKGLRLALELNHFGEAPLRKRSKAYLSTD